MKTLRFLLKKEFKQIFRNKNILRMILVIPIVQLLILPLAADYEIKNINVSVVDHDRSTYSRELINKIRSSGYFGLKDVNSSFEKSFQDFEEDNADLIIEIPKDFERGIIYGQRGELFIAVNAINGTKATMGNNYVSRIIADFAVDVGNPIQLVDRTASQPIEVVPVNWFNRLLNYSSFMVPGILVVLVTMVGSYMCALNIVKEKEVGTIEQINVTPIKKHTFILGKLIPFWILGTIVFTIGLFGIAGPIYGIVSVGSLLTLYAFLAIYLIALLGIGLIISTYSSTQQQAMSLAFFCIMIFLLMSGLFTLIESMPTWAQWISRLNPVTYFIEVVRLVILKGSNFSHLRNHFLVIAIMAIFFNTWAILNYKKTS